MTSKVDRILKEIIYWASINKNIYAAALVGSWARGTARADSDIDLMFLTSDPSLFIKDRTWIDEINWENIGSSVKEWKDKDYGLARSRHIYLIDGTEIEFCFGFLDWAAIAPIDPGTFKVVSDGCRILYDPEKLLLNLIDKVRLI
jgi:uncharacterized protein